MVDQTFILNVLYHCVGALLFVTVGKNIKDGDCYQQDDDNQLVFEGVHHCSISPV